MCGIVGLVGATGAVTAAEVAVMNRAIAHRGPDGEGVRCAGNVGIGMRRLSIIDLEGGDQPISNESGDIHVVQNGEIYNYRELRRALERAGHRFRTQSDTEVIVHAYEEYGGEAFATRLRGMFAAAVWDTRRRVLWLVRDRLGQKPLYYINNQRGFAFASEARALLCSGVANAEVDPGFLADYLTFGEADIDRSALRGVRQLLPGCSLQLSTEDRSARVRRYWKLGSPAASTEGALDRPAATEALAERFAEAVRTHLVSDVPVGAFLSGGVDSSAVVGAMVEAGAPDLKTFSIGFDEEGFNELPYAREIAEKWGCEHYEETVRPDAFQAVDEIVTRMDEPFADASAIPTWYVSKLAARHVKVVLSGDGGDELFGGYERYAVADRRRYLDRIPRIVRQLGATLGGVLPSAAWGRYFLDYAARGPAARFASELCLFPPMVQRDLLRPEYAPERLGNRPPLERAADFFRELPGTNYVARCMHFDTLRYLPMDILAKVDRMTMAHGLEARPPLLDHEFVEFAWSLPIEYKYQAPERRKVVFRDAVRKLVPAHLLERKKAGFSVPTGSWFAGPLYDTFAATALSPDSRVAEYLNPPAVLALLDENRRGRRDHGLRLWAILGLELWLRQLAEPTR